jgi:endoglycosylceramidase
MTNRAQRGAVLFTVLAALSLLAACGAASRSTAAAPGVAAASPTAGPVGPLSAPGGPFLIDRFGRVVLLHGANLVYKVPPYEVVVNGTGPNVLTPAEAERMASLGFDVVRLGIIWKGLEPGTSPMNSRSICSPGAPRSSHAGQFDAATLESYLKRLDATVALLGRFGIYSLIDMHQDVYNEAFAGEGAPDWAVCTDGLVPRPQRNVPDWSVNLNGPGVLQAYEHFWNNDVVGNLQGEFDSTWARVAAHFRVNRWVIGYDPFNEPYGEGLPPAGDSRTFDAELQCFYVGRSIPSVDQAGLPITCPPDDPQIGLIPQIEAADPQHLVFYEPNYTTDSGVPSHIGPMPFPRLVLNTHDYCFLHVPNGPEPPDFASTCGPLESAVFEIRATERLRAAASQQPGGPGWMLTEFGATTDTSDLERVTADADAHLIGWMYWQWLRYQDPTGSHSSGLWPPTSSTPAMLSVLSRTYAKAIAGTPVAMSFDPSSGRFSLEYRSSPTSARPTVIAIQRSTHYQPGYCARVTGGRVSSPPDATTLDVMNAPDASTVLVTVVPGRC